MKVVHIAFSYGLANVGGATIAASRIHGALRRHGVDSYYLCTYNFGPKDDSVIEVPSKRSLRRSIFLLGCRILRFATMLLSPHRMVAPHLIGSGMLKEIGRINPDVVHVHRICPDAISFRELRKLKCPVVISLHDFWMINAVNPYPQTRDEVMFTGNSDGLGFVAKWLFTRKAKFIQSTNPSFVAPSEWARKVCAESLMGQNRYVTYIPYVQDPSVRLYPSKRVASSGRVRLLYGSYAGRRPSIKGYCYLEQAIREMSAEEQNLFEIFVFGEIGNDEKIGETPVHFLGIVCCPNEMINVYHCADIFVFPSLQETQGQVKIEAMLCGLPVVAYRRTACAEGIEPMKTGLIVEGDSAGELKQALLKLAKLLREGRVNHSEIHQITARSFDEDVIIGSYISNYEGVIRRGGTENAKILAQ